MEGISFYEPHYDVVVIGASLAGCSAALTLAKEGKRVLVLEQHNLPGGVATSFVRGGVEMEATLHEMISIGPKEHPLSVRKYLEEMGVDVDWLRIDDAYRLVTPDLDVALPAGRSGDFDAAATAIANACGEEKDGKVYKKAMSFFDLCTRVNDSINELSFAKIKKSDIILHHKDFVATLGYSAKDVLDSFDFPKKALDLLSPYWIYLGSPLNELPFTIFSVLIAEYIGYGPYVPKGYSFEIALKLAERAEKLGVQIEYRQRVEKILLEKGKVKGVRTLRGDEISCDYVICGAYPNEAYEHMVEPKVEIPEAAIKSTNAKEVGLSCFSVVMLLDKSAEELGIKDYSVFHSLNGFDSLDAFEKGKKREDWDFFTSICLNIANPGCTPEGTCQYSITAMPCPSAFDGVDEENYLYYRNELAKTLIEEESKRLGFDLKDHIKELVIETPITIAHYTGAFRGAVYGYRHKMDDHVVARQLMADKEHYVEGLFFAGAHSGFGDGMGPCILNGKTAAMELLGEEKRRKAK